VGLLPDPADRTEHERVARHYYALLVVEVEKLDDAAVVEAGRILANGGAPADRIHELNRVVNTAENVPYSDGRAEYPWQHPERFRTVDEVVRPLLAWIIDGHRQWRPLQSSAGAASDANEHSRLGSFTSQGEGSSRQAVTASTDRNLLDILRRLKRDRDRAMGEHPQEAGWGKGLSGVVRFGRPSMAIRPDWPRREGEVVPPEAADFIDARAWVRERVRLLPDAVIGEDVEACRRQALDWLGGTLYDELPGLAAAVFRAIDTPETRAAFMAAVIQRSWRKAALVAWMQGDAPIAPDSPGLGSPPIIRSRIDGDAADATFAGCDRLLQGQATPPAAMHSAVANLAPRLRTALEADLKACATLGEGATLAKRFAWIVENYEGPDGFRYDRVQEESWRRYQSDARKQVGLPNGRRRPSPELPRSAVRAADVRAGRRSD
jgi:hypothetical protein